MDDNFKLLTRGSVILEWSPSGARTRFVVQKKHAWGYDLILLDESDNLRIGSVQMTPEDIDTGEGFGSTYTYMLGEVYKLPDFL